MKGLVWKRQWVREVVRIKILSKDILGFDQCNLLIIAAHR